MSKVIVHYINQFFAGKGGEDMADYKPEVIDGTAGPGTGIQGALGDAGKIVKTIICGDNFFNEHEEEAIAFVKKVLTETKADLLIAGPGFNAGRYGMACGNAAKVAFELGIPAISGLYEENPGYDVFKAFMYTIKTGNSAVSMREAVPAIGALAKKLLKGEKICCPEKEGLLPRGVRQNYFAEERGAKRAVDMLIKKIKGEAFVTEYPMPVFDRVPPQPPVKDITKAKIALVTSGGVVPKGNPDHIEASNASHYGEYSIAGMAALSSKDSETAHGGYDPTYCNANPNRVLPVDVLRDLEKEGKIGKLHDKYYTTVGNGTAVKRAKKFAEEIVQKLVKDGVQAVILTST